MKRGVVIIIGAVFLVIFAIVAIMVSRSPQAPSSVTLKVWSPFDEGKVYQEMAAEFLATHPGTKLEFRHVPAKDAKEYEAKVVDAIASGVGPDVWLIRNDWLPKHEPKLTPSPTTLTWSRDKKISDEQALISLLSEAVYQQNVRNGKLYALPIAVDSLALYLNISVLGEVRRELSQSEDEEKQELLSKKPETWDQVVALSNLITKKNKDSVTRSGIALGTIENTYAPVDAYLSFLYQKEGSLFTQDEAEVSIHHGDGAKFPGRDSLDFFTSFSNPLHPNYSWNTKLGEPVKAFVDGKTAMFVGYSSVRLELLRLNKDFADVTVLPLPQQQVFALPNQRRVDYAAYWTHAVSKTSPSPTLAWQLLQALTDPAASRMYEKATLKPAIYLLRDVSGKPSASDLDDRTLFAHQATTSATGYKPEWQFVDETLQTMIRSVVELGQSPQSAVDTTAEVLKKGQP